MGPVVAPKTTEFVRTLFRELSDGEWHDREVVTQKAMIAIPPGQAFRTAEVRRRNAKNHSDQRAYHHDRDHQIRVGARFMVSRALTNRHSFQRRTLPDGTLQVRLTPTALERAAVLLAAGGVGEDAERDQHDADGGVVEGVPVRAGVGEGLTGR